MGFERSLEVVLKPTNISDDMLGVPEKISANNDVLVALDYFDSQLFSTFDLKCGTRLQRFGSIGEGPAEVPLGTLGLVHGNDYVTYSSRPQIISKYNPETGDLSYERLAVSFDEKAKVSRLGCIADSLYISMGTYNDRFKYVLFSPTGEVIDSAVTIAGIDNPRLNAFHRFLAEQGNIAVSPAGNKMAAVTNYSDNIDFIKVDNGSINVIRVGNRPASLTPKEIFKGAFQMVPDKDLPIGFIDVAANDTHVFALYVDEPFGSGSYSSCNILVYDWDGKPQYLMVTDKKVSGIAANDKTLYCITTNGESGYTLESVEI